MLQKMKTIFVKSSQRMSSAALLFLKIRFPFTFAPWHHTQLLHPLVYLSPLLASAPFLSLKRENA